MTRAIFSFFLAISSSLIGGVEYNLVNLAIHYPDIMLNIRYATKNNCVQESIYSRACCYVQKDVAKALHDVQEELMSKYSLRLVIFDGYQPRSARQMIWDLLPNNDYIADPLCQDNDHARGCAVDVSLLNMDGDQMDMGTDFDCLTVKSKRSCTMLSGDVLERRAILDEVMKKHGFIASREECWWHYVYKNAAQYPMLNFEFEDLD